MDRARLPAGRAVRGRALRQGASFGAALALLLVACGGDDGGSRANETLEEPADAGSVGGGGDPCPLVGDDAVAELLGQEVHEGELESIEGAEICRWETVAESASPQVDDPISFTVEVGDVTDEIAGQLDSALADGSNLELDDIGDRAVHVCGLGADGTSCGTYDSVAALVGDLYLEVDLSNWGYPDDYGEEEGAEIVRDGARLVADLLS